MMTRQNIISAFFIGLLIYISYNVFLILSPFLHPLFWASVLAFICFPFHKKIAKIFPKNNSLASFVTTLLIVCVILPVLIFVIFNLVQETKNIYQWISGMFRNGFFDRIVRKFNSIQLVQQIENSSFLNWEVMQATLEEWSVNLTQNLMNFALKQLGTLVKHLITAVVNFFLIFILLFFFFRDGEKIWRFLYTITPLEEDTKDEIFSQITSTFTAVLRGQLVTSMAQSFLSGIFFWMLGLPLPIFFAGVAFFTSLIPVLGAAAVWVGFVIYLLMLEKFKKALILFILGFFIISTVDNFIKPYVIGNRTKLPYLLLFLGILGGLQVYGMLGIFVAPVVLSLFFVLVKIFRERVLNTQTTISGK